MKLIPKMGVLPSHGNIDPELIILHHTVTPTVKSAENGLKSRKLGYHFIIDTNGDIHQYADVKQKMYHASGYNSVSIGISVVGGGKYGPMNETQCNAIVDLIIDYLLPRQDFKYITGHKHASKAGKIDPRFPGEPENDVNWEIDTEFMDEFAELTGLEFLTKGEL